MSLERSRETYDREVDEESFKVWQRFQNTLYDPTPSIPKTDIMYTSHDEFDLGVHGFVKHLCRFSTTEIDIGCQGLKMIEIVIR
jgi:hypothetical protein